MGFYATAINRMNIAIPADFEKNRKLSLTKLSQTHKMKCIRYQNNNYYEKWR